MMTWLSKRDLADIDQSRCVQSTSIEDEIAKGVILERRSVLHMPALAAAALLFGARPLKTHASTHSSRNPSLESEELTWEQFLERCVPLAGSLYENKSAAGQDAYLFSIAAQAVLLQDVPISSMRQFRQFDPKYEFELAHRGFPFIVIHWRMEPHAILPAHCHPGTSVCTVGLEGQTLVRHFEPIGDAPAYNAPEQSTFLIRETKSQLIAPRSVSTLSESRDNIHYFVAGSEGARGIDITTHYESDGSFSFLRFDADNPRDEALGLFEADWVGSDLQCNF